MPRTDSEIVDLGFWPKFRRFAARLPFADELLAAYFAAMDPETPAHVRMVIIGALAYFVVPTDLVPDFVVRLGFTDDAAVLATALRTLSAYVRPAHRTRAVAIVAELKAG